MLQTTLLKDGWVTIPAEILIANHWVEGTEFTVESVNDGIVLRPVKPAATNPTSATVGTPEAQNPRTDDSTDR